MNRFLLLLLAATLVIPPGLAQEHWNGSRTDYHCYGGIRRAAPTIQPPHIDDHILYVKLRFDGDKERVHEMEEAIWELDAASVSNKKGALYGPIETVYVRRRDIDGIDRTLERALQIRYASGDLAAAHKVEQSREFWHGHTYLFRSEGFQPRHDERLPSSSITWPPPDYTKK